MDMSDDVHEDRECVVSAAVGDRWSRQFVLLENRWCPRFNADALPFRRRRQYHSPSSNLRLKSNHYYDSFFSALGNFLSLCLEMECFCRFNDNTMRGVAKSQAPLPTTMGNRHRQLGAYPKTIPAIKAFFEFPSHSIENGHKRAKSNTSENGRFSP